ncbi:WXG100 family type VII secretion target [Microbacterium trichothecenolyticum]|uniref:ESAT-6-like protein n=1 Tax=Microbacterium trichothecenolyticum TaxID=69370 RepID=A0ABU0TVA7_MICTR|nr:WXG100 family type VII secretion target [Microbacterium trichothecenolyticum]MDQ1123584.1 WXG100 family type VII secretion target [Microbacterium trichothecenolyticum]
MSERISAAEGALARGAEAVMGAHADIADSARRVLAELDELSATWSGEAATSYGVLVNEWTAGANRLNDVLITLSTALTATARDQEAVEEQHRTTIHGLGALLGGE